MSREAVKRSVALILAALLWGSSTSAAMATASASPAPSDVAGTTTTSQVVAASSDNTDQIYVDSSLSEFDTVVLNGTVTQLVSDFSDGSSTNSFIYTTPDGQVIGLPSQIDTNLDSGDQIDVSYALTPEMINTLSDAGIDITDEYEDSTLSTIIADNVEISPISSITQTLELNTSSLQTAPSTRTHRTVAIIVNMTNATNELNTTDARSQVNTAGSYWLNQTNGKVTNMSSFSTVQTYDYGHSCGYFAAHSADFLFKDIPARYSYLTSDDSIVYHLIALIPEQCTSSLGGLAGRGTVGSSIHVPNGYSNVGTLWALGGDLQVKSIAHELGHNFSLAHAGMRMGDSWYVYKDDYSVMGGGKGRQDANTGEIHYYAGIPALDTAYKDFLGITSSQEKKVVKSTGTFTLYPRSNSSGLRGLAFQTNSGRSYYLELRFGTGTDEDSGYSNDVPINLLDFDGSFIGTFSTGNGVTLTSFGQDASGSDAYEADTSELELLPVKKSGDSYYYTFSAGWTWTSSDGSVKVTVSSYGTDYSSAQVKVEITKKLEAPWKIAWSGSQKVGSTLKVTPKGWYSSNGVTVSYQWKRGNTYIAGATSSSYKVTAADAGQTLTVKITGSKDGYTSTTVYKTFTIRK